MLLYNLVERHNPLRPDEAKKLYVSLKSLGLVRVDEVTKRIAKEINIHEDICRSVLNTWNEVAIDLLTAGHSVELGNAGYVYLRASSEGASNEEEASSNLVRDIKARISFSKQAKESFNRTTRINVKHLTAGINVKDQPENSEQE